MKVALLTLNYLPSTGGLVSYVKSMASELTSAGHEVSIFCAKERGGESEPIELLDDCKVHRIDALDTSLFQKFYTPYSISHTFKSYFAKNKILDDFDIIIVRHVYLAYALLGLTLLDKSIFLTPLISPRLVKINARSEPLFNKLYSWWLIPQLHFLESRVMRSGMKIGVLSKSKQQEVADYYGIKKPGIFLPGINKDRFFADADTEKSNKGPVTFISVCRLVEEKNIELVIRGLSYLFKNNKLHFKYIIVGDGPLASSLKALAAELGVADMIDFIGFVHTPEDYYRKADLFILPSSYEGFGHVYIEANACGIPVLGLSNKIPGVITACDEIIQEDINGFLIHKNSIDGIADAISKYLYSERSKSDWSQQCVDLISKNYSWGKHFNELCK